MGNEIILNLLSYLGNKVITETLRESLSFKKPINHKNFGKTYLHKPP